MSKETLKSFFGSIDTVVSNEQSGYIPEDFDGAVAFLGSKVEQFLVENHLATSKKMNQGIAFVANESYAVENIDNTLGAEKVVSLVKDCKVPAALTGSAAKRVAALLNACLGCEDNATIWGNYAFKSNEQNVGFQSLESLYPQSLMSTINDVGMEVFGIQMDRVQPDLKVILTVALLQFHTSLTPRIVPVQSIGQGNVTITRESLTIHDLSTPKAAPVRMINLYRDPTPVSTLLKRIEPLSANDSATDPVLVEDGIYKFNKAINMFDLAIDASKPGYEKYNHTDFVEDNAVLDGILISITKPAVAAVGSVGEEGYVAAQDAVTEQFMLKIPASKGRLTQISNDMKSTDRRVAIDRFPIILFSNTAMIPATANGTTASTILGNLTANQGIQVNFNVNAHIDRQYSTMDASGFASLAAYNKLAAPTAAEVSFAGGLQVALVGFTMDARYNEDNKRKTNIRGELNRRTMSYELPGGRNFVMDNAIGQEGMVNAAARLAQLEHIGRDCKNLDIITGVMNEVHDSFEMLGAGEVAHDVLGAQYAAGDIVNPYVYVDVLDFSQVVTVRTSDASGDLKQFIKQKLTKVTSSILAQSFYAQQLADGAKVTFRLITSNHIMGNAIQARHIHQHLDIDIPATGGVEHAFELDNGVHIECVTTTFESMNDRMVLIPFLSSNQSSILNFGIDYDQGTMIGNYTNTGDGAVHQRIFSVTRELLIPTNVIGAILDVQGLDSVI